MFFGKNGNEFRKRYILSVIIEDGILYSKVNLNKDWILTNMDRIA